MWVKILGRLFKISFNVMKYVIAELQKVSKISFRHFRLEISLQRETPSGASIEPSVLCVLPPLLLIINVSREKLCFFFLLFER